jgi:hypothetical protein
MNCTGGNTSILSINDSFEEVLGSAYERHGRRMEGIRARGLMVLNHGNSSQPKLLWLPGFGFLTEKLTWAAHGFS